MERIKKQYPNSAHVNNSAKKEPFITVQAKIANASTINSRRSSENEAVTHSNDKASLNVSADKINPANGGDYFNADGSWNKEMSKKYNGADYNIFVMSADQKSKKLLTDMPLNTAEERAVVEKVIRNYALQLGIKYEKGNYRKGSGLVNLKKSPTNAPANQIPAKGDKPAVGGNPAFTIGRDISINYTGGKINSLLSNYHNLKSTLYHEWQHKNEYNKDLKDASISDNQKGTQDGVEHLKIYLAQMEEPGFKHTSQEFKNGIATVGGQLLKAYENAFDEDIVEINALVDKMNKVLTKYGIIINKGYQTNDMGMSEEHWVVPKPTITKK